MRVPRVRLSTVARAVLAAGAGAVLAASAAASPDVATPSAGRPLRTAVVDPFSAMSAVELRRVRSSGASFFRLAVSWAQIAPRGERPPADFDGADPRSPLYRWQPLDRQIASIRARGLDVILNVGGAPEWAQGRGPRPNGGAFRPSPVHLADFARAAALRYSGRFEGLPRVRVWQVWNEPNLTHFLNPQTEGGRLVSAGWYRRLVNEFSAAVKSVHPDNLVVAGGLAPFTCHSTAPTNCSTAPLRFMRAFLCVSRALRPTCSLRTRFDVWAHHPYTSGGPTHQAFRRDDASIGDLPEMAGILRAAYRRGHVVSPKRPEFWVTEFSWDTRPPDRGGVPAALHARWVAEGLYRMWRSGVSLVTWWTIRDQPYPRSPFQSGLYFRGPTLGGDRPKPALQAFRFPFVALAERGGVRVWGRTPTSRPGAVAVQQGAPGRWRRIAVLRADRYGIFTDRLKVGGRGALRAVVGPGSRSATRPFSLRVPPDLRVNPFGDYGQDRK